MPHQPTHMIINRIKRSMFGAPKRTDQAHHERLSVFTGLAVFSSDAISSVAYATEEILLVLAVAGAAASAYSLSVGLAIILLVFIVAASYNQTIHAYPGGGGAYIVSKDNLGIGAGLTAGSALLVDYVLTVAVSSASGVAAITSAIPSLHGHEILLCLISIAFIAWVNLRGVKESGAAFSVPTYGFMAIMFLMIAVGLYRALTGHWAPHAPIAVGFGFGGIEYRSLTANVTMFMILRAFASGCTALSGIEAVSNGVQAFKPPEAENAIKTMKWERTILYTMFGGITVLAYGFAILPKHDETVLSQLAHETFGSGFFYYMVQVMTTMILLLAANTAYADFPRLAGLIAKDGYLPRRLASRGNTLVLNGGVYLLAFLSAILVVLFRGSVHHLIPLYAVGVFLAFTMSQTGMVVHWLKFAKRPNESTRRHAWSIFINGLGALLSAVALVVIAITKFLTGAWIVCIVIPLLILYFRSVHGYYTRFRAKVESLFDERMPMDDTNKVRVILTIGGLSPLIDHSLRVARKISTNISAVFVATEPEFGTKMSAKWDLVRHEGVQLTVLESPYRTLVPPLRKYLARLRAEDPSTLINLLVPIIVTTEPFDAYLHNGSASQLIQELRFSEGILLTVIPFFVNMDPDAGSVIACYPPTAD
jgi:amino acid transporter